MPGIKAKFISGTLWTFVEKSGSMAVRFAVGVILARLLTPSAYGTVGVLSVFTAFAGVFADCGIRGALIQRKSITPLDCNSVFYASLAAAAFFYLILFFSAPAIARFYSMPELKPILRVLALSLVFAAVNSVQSVEIERKLLFKTSFKISLFATAVSATTGITLAYMGYGPWALVWSATAQLATAVATNWFVIAWRPQLSFSLTSLKSLLSFGWKNIASSLVAMLDGNIYSLVVGKFYTPADLAFTSRGRSLPAMAMEVTQNSLVRSAMPTLCRFQDDLPLLRHATRRMVRCSAFATWPVLAGCAATAHNLVPLLFGSQWHPAAIFASLACIRFMFWPLALVQQTIFALGRSDLLLSLQIARSAVTLAILCSTIWISPLACFAAISLLTPIAHTIINSRPNKKLFGYPLSMQLADISKLSAVTALMASATLLADLSLRSTIAPGSTPCALALRLAAQITPGTISYFALSYAMRIKEFGEYASIVLPPHLATPIIRRTSTETTP